MAQMVATPPLAGLQICINAGAGTQSKILAGTGDPNLAATDSSAGDLANASTGSLFLRMDGSTSTSLYTKTAATTIAAPTGTWTGK